MPNMPPVSTMYAPLRRVGGLLGDIWDSQNTLQKMGLLPVVGDVAGFAGDVQSMYENPEERTWGNAGLTGLGLLPFVPAGLGIIKDIPAPIWNRAAKSVPVGINPTKSEMKELFRDEDTLRALLHGDDAYFWPSSQALHADVGNYFKLPKNKTEEGIYPIEEFRK